MPKFDIETDMAPITLLATRSTNPKHHNENCKYRKHDFSCDCAALLAAEQTIIILINKGFIDAKT